MHGVDARARKHRCLTLPEFPTTNKFSEHMLGKTTAIHRQNQPSNCF